MEQHKDHLPIEQMDVYRQATTLADELWDQVFRWPSFARDTIGKQLARAADSIGANLVEADGRYGEADALHFLVIARGSARETRFWLQRAASRRIIDQESASRMDEAIDHVCRSINRLITYRRDHPIGKRVKETPASYEGALAEHRKPKAERLFEMQIEDFKFRN